MKHLFLAFILLSCTHKPATKSPQRSIVFIPGMHFDETSWKEVGDLLSSQNFSVKTLGRLGRENKDPNQIVLKNIAQLNCDQTPPSSIVVGHNIAGAIINEMVGLCPLKISQIIYVAGIVPLKGEKPFETFLKADQKEYAKAVETKNRRLIPKTPKYFFSIGDVAYKYDLISSPKIFEESGNININPVEYKPELFESIPKSYIYTGRDKIMSAKSQEGYTMRAKITKTVVIPTGHYPMLSAAPQLAIEIQKLSK